MLEHGRLDQYEDVELIGESGMAAVYRARDSETGERVALKIPHLRLEADVVFYERFQREEAIGLRLDHPSVVRFLRPRAKSRPYIVMEYVEAETLHACLCAGAGLPVARAVEIARQLAEILVYVHGQRVVHRDLKPGNVMLLPDGRLKLLDFGIALDEAGAGRARHTALGTPEYMAPEQIEGRPGDARVDLYALGTIFYEMLTGALPYDAASTPELLRAKTRVAPIPPSRRVPGLDPRLEEIALRALEPSPDSRYATAQAMLDDLRDPSKVVAGVHPAPTARGASDRGRIRRAAPFLVIGAILASPVVSAYLGGCDAHPRPLPAQR